MKVVFAGPSLAGLRPHDVPDLSLQPPAQCGDIWRAVETGATLIGLIDGYFETRRSPWHKEILHALAKNIPVLGASSIGALRAAEMKPFGMIGVGLVARLFASGVLKDDDEVAMLHGPEATGYVPLTDPLVNIRVTFRRARRSGAISVATERRIIECAKSLFYKDRTFEAILTIAKKTTSSEEVDRLSMWLTSNKADVKRQDAERLLSILQAGARPSRRPSTPPFPSTSFWRQFILEFGCRPTIRQASAEPAGSQATLPLR